MLKIERQRNGFKVWAVESIFLVSGLGRVKCFAKDAKEAAQAVLHYYGDTHTIDYHQHRGEKRSCPFCRQMREEAKKKR